ncbi:YciI family protein [Schumannella sp. 10F1B-5-1]|uniref:YciI family protein n=1 Tax=Schumannella sp. 10F1B-5-1 TaxID=2590780 RepID=UPI0011324B35|nr:YciI family protein [Schumannella sp. 10F1B-5-1]TPW78314.1 transcription initiation protein [Schumannella sp. 10F1B-5-1]
MTKYLFTFPAAAMRLTPEEFEAAGRDSHAEIRAAKEAGVYVFGGGLDATVAPVRVAGDGAQSAEPYEQTRELDGGLLVLELPDRAAALEWARRFAAACRCDQELREFMFDPES